MTTRATSLQIFGTDPASVDELRRSGIDHGGNPVEPFVDEDGGWPLRCCLTDSQPGDEIAIVAWSPFPWRGPYAETGPVVIHAQHCDAPVLDHVPTQFLSRPQIIRPYGHDRRIAYEHIALVEPDGSLPDLLADVLARPEIDFVLSRNVLAGCYSFTARI